MRSPFRFYCSAVLAALAGLSALVALNGPVQAQPPAGLLVTPTLTPPPCGPAWRVVSSPNPGGYWYLYSVAARTAGDVWAVGSARNGSGVYQTLIDHWDGSAWTAVPSPNLGTGNNTLNSVTAVSATDAWAVGWYYPDAVSSAQALIEHWNGSAWTVVPGAALGAGGSALRGVAALSAGDIWAVGDYASGSSGGTLVERWDGSVWTHVASPNLTGPGDWLNGVAVVSATDVWAVGEAGSGQTLQTLTEHWNGSAWSVVPGPDPGAPNSRFAGVAAAGPADIWAVGVSFDTQGTITAALIEHWDGSSWAIVPAAPPLGALESVAATGPADVWAVGIAADGTAGSTLIEHWDGSAWSVVASPNPSPVSNFLYGVAALAATDAWAVGTDQGTLILHYSDPCATPTATPAGPSPTATPAGPSSTATPAGPSLTPTPTATPPAGSATATGAPPTSVPPTATSVPATRTPCALTFSDVHPSDYFYTPVFYLACHGVVSGYADGTFRPYNATTRAQMVKIVVLGFGRAISTPSPPGQYTFADVPPAQPFFAVIETAAADNIVSGYGCSGPGEPCDSQHRPYFRPSANVTRGQLSKIVVATAAWPLQNPPTGTFADVAPGSAFYEFVETAACHGIVSGYSCGGPGEPCDPAQRPYFRQGNNATRGQIAKIVYGAITGSSTCAPGRP